MDATRTNRDKFTISYSLWVGLLLLLYVVSYDLDRIFNLYLAVVPLLLLPTIVVALSLIAILIWNATNRRWRRVLSIIAAPFLAYSFFVVLGALGVDSERIRFEHGKGYYVDQVSQIPRTDVPRLKTFDWGSTGGVAVPNFIYTLVYDESDEIGLPPEQRSIEWRSRAQSLCPGTQMCSILKTEPPGHVVSVRKMQAQFYLVTELFQ